MKNLKLFSFPILLVILSVGIMGCKKDPIKAPAGPAGVDGNANVKTFIYENPIWNGTYWMDINTGLTDDQIKNDVILTYIELTNLNNVLRSVPGDIDVYYFDKFILNSLSIPSIIGGIRILCRNQAGAGWPTASLPNVNFVKIVVIKSTGTTTVTGNGMILSGKDAMLHDLESANIDVNDYKAVCNYYGVSAE